MQLCVGKLAEDSRKFLLSTGEYGAAQFHEAAQEKAGSYTGWLRSDHNFKDGGKTLVITSYSIHYTKLYEKYRR